MSGFIETPAMSDIKKLQSQIDMLQETLDRLLRHLYINGMLDDDQVSRLLEKRL